MTLKRWVFTYLIAIHVLLAVAALWLLREHRVWLYVVEALFVLSIITAIVLFNRIFSPPAVSSLGPEFLKERDFQSRFRIVGHPEVDHLIQLYNSIAESLQNERIKTQEKEFFLAKLLEASPAGIVTFDFDRRVDLVNPVAERMLATPAHHLKGCKAEEIASPLTRDLPSLPVNESIVVTLSGRRQIKCWKSQLMDRGFPREFVIFEELTEELRRLEKASYERLIRLMSHEVNNSIGAANSLLHSCLRYAEQVRAEDRSDFESALNIAVTRTEHLNGFMRALSDLVRLPPPQLQVCDLLALTRNSIALHQSDLESRRIEIAWQLECPGLAVRADVAQMEQVLVNIIRNAIEAIDRDGTITIISGESADWQCLCIADTGAGIPPEVSAKLFTPFFSTKAHGQGIGLTLTAEILAQHGFDYSLTSDNGVTRFCILF